jgi:hypothetical protein
MKRAMFAGIVVALLTVAPLHAFDLGGIIKELGLEQGTAGSLDSGTIDKGLREALSVATERAVKTVGATDGYFGNQAIKILLPEKFRLVGDTLSKLGYQKEVDGFVLSMNRAAEKAAPKAAEHFVGAIKEMTFDDARGILNGGSTAATDYLRRKTSDRIYASFKPVVVESMNQVGVTRSYKEMMAPYEALPLVPKQALDLDHYVTDKAVGGLFQMLAEEEKRIRANPAARTTELLRTVFGQR